MLVVWDDLAFILLIFSAVDEYHISCLAFPFLLVPFYFLAFVYLLFVSVCFSWFLFWLLLCILLPFSVFITYFIIFSLSMYDGDSISKGNIPLMPVNVRRSFLSCSWIQACTVPLASLSKVTVVLPTFNLPTHSYTFSWVEFYNELTFFSFHFHNVLTFFSEFQQVSHSQPKEISLLLIVQQWWNPQQSVYVCLKSTDTRALFSACSNYP